ncbi:MAG: glutamate 5-kinase [Hyphomonadaceae bacterium]|nr:glutamate 5-kinase [Hyphomonadaceae bacterium]MBC6411891.1 glutamate 5-kinase [Hyphomonadaceae bacterium]
MAALSGSGCNPLSDSRRIVIKIGSALLIDTDTGQIRTAWLDSLSRDIRDLARAGKDVILVSSGAVALGRERLGLTGNCLTLSEKQACAAAGQALLTQAYERALSQHNIVTAQALLTLDDTENRRRWLNARETLGTLLSVSAVPIINENDTVATDEIRYGDNDRLAARTAQMVGADRLILLSDIDGLYNTDPRTSPDAVHIAKVSALPDEIMAMAGQANSSAHVGSGGMATKLVAADIAMKAGCHMCIMDGNASAPLSRLQSGATATWFIPSQAPRDARRQWISGSLKPKGDLVIDTGATVALSHGKSLLAIGVTDVSGSFNKGDAVRIINMNGNEIARGLVNYGSESARKIKRRNSSDIVSILGFTNGPTLVHRDNLVMHEGNP